MDGFAKLTLVEDVAVESPVVVRHQWIRPSDVRAIKDCWNGKAHGNGALIKLDGGVSVRVKETGAEAALLLGVAEPETLATLETAVDEYERKLWGESFTIIRELMGRLVPRDAQATQKEVVSVLSLAFQPAAGLIATFRSAIASAKKSTANG